MPVFQTLHNSRPITSTPPLQTSQPDEEEEEEEQEWYECEVCGNETWESMQYVAASRSLYYYGGDTYAETGEMEIDEFTDTDNWRCSSCGSEANGEQVDELENRH